MATSIVHKEWRPIPDWEGVYWASNLGRIKSAARSRRWLTERVVGGTVHYLGYRMVTLKDIGRKTKIAMAHVLVCAAFLGPKPEGLEVNHKDGNKLNNCLDNLEYVTRSQNHIHRCRVLGQDLGEKNRNSKLTEKEVVEIRRLRAVGMPESEVSKRFGTCVANIWNIVSRKTWKHVP